MAENRGRPKKEPTKLIAVPVNKIATVAEVLGRPIKMKQTPIVKIRVPVSDIERVREALKNDTE